MRAPVGLAGLVLVLVASAIAAAPASAASCVSGGTQWTNPHGGSWGDATNWSNGVPSAQCDVLITLPGTYRVEVGRNLGIGGEALSITIGGASGTQTLYDNNSACGATPCASDTQLKTYSGGITIYGHGALQLAQGDVASSGDGDVTLNGGRLWGNGTVIGGVDNKGGRVTPTAGSTYDGVLNITSWYTQDRAGTLTIVAPTDSARSHTAALSAAGTTLDGTLRISGSAPVRRRSFRAIEAGTTATGGRFSKVVFTDQRYDVDWDSDGLVLTPVSAHCQSGSTAWTDASGGDWFDAANWSNGVPSKKCDALITQPGTYTVTVPMDPGGGVAKSVTVGADSGTQTLEHRGTEDECSANGSCRIRHMTIGRGGVTIRDHGQLRLHLAHMHSVGTVRVQGGRLEGQGELIADGGVVNTGGTVAPVIATLGGYRTYPETLHITGDYRQDRAATLDLRDLPDPATREFGVLYVNGRASLDGTLHLDSSAELTEPLAVVVTAHPAGAFSTITFGHAHYEVDHQSNGVFIRPLGSTCSSGSTSWTNPDGGAWDDPKNWSNGRPSPACDVFVTMPGDYVVSAGIIEVGWKSYDGVDANARSITLGGSSGTQTISFSSGCSPDCYADASLHVGDGGITINPHGDLAAYGHIAVSGAVRVDGGTLDASGTLQTDGGLVNAGGHVQLSGAPLRVVGSYRQDADATLGYLTAYGFPALSVSGPVTLDGTLAIAGPEPGNPPLAHPATATVIQADSARTGTFANVANGGAPYDVNYDGPHGSVYLTADGACRSGTTSWAGAEGNWEDPGNWTNGVPTSACDVLILVKGSYVLLNSTAMVHDVRVGRGAELSLAGAFLSMSGDYRQDAGSTLYVGSTPDEESLPAISAAGSLTLDGRLFVSYSDPRAKGTVLYGAQGRTGTFSLVHPNTGAVEAAYDRSSVYLRNDTMAPVLRNVSARYPSNGKLRVQFRSSEDAYVTVRVTDASGAQVASYDVSIEAGYNWFGLDTAPLQPGRYRVTFVARDGSHTSTPTRLVIKVRA